MCTILCKERVGHAASRGGVGKRYGRWAGGAKAGSTRCADGHRRASRISRPGKHRPPYFFSCFFLLFTHRLQVMTLCAFCYWLLSTIVRVWWVILFWFIADFLALKYIDSWWKPAAWGAHLHRDSNYLFCFIVLVVSRHCVKKLKSVWHSKAISEVWLWV